MCCSGWTGDLRVDQGGLEYLASGLIRLESVGDRQWDAGAGRVVVTRTEVTNERVECSNSAVEASNHQVPR